MHLVYTRDRKHIGTKWSRVTCLVSLLAAAQSLLLEGLEDFRGSQRLNNHDRKQAIQRINKTVYQTILKY
jgi:predicted component of type VI protein secretion system